MVRSLSAILAVFFCSLFGQGGMKEELYALVLSGVALWLSILDFWAFAEEHHVPADVYIYSGVSKY